MPRGVEFTLRGKSNKKDGIRSQLKFDKYFYLDFNRLRRSKVTSKLQFFGIQGQRLVWNITSKIAKIFDKDGVEIAFTDPDIKRITVENNWGFHGKSTNNTS